MLDLAAFYFGDAEALRLLLFPRDGAEEVQATCSSNISGAPPLQHQLQGLLYSGNGRRACSPWRAVHGYGDHMAAAKRGPHLINSSRRTATTTLRSMTELIRR